MLALDDPRWSRLFGGYRLPFDPRPALARLEAAGSAEGPQAAAWEELWDGLHHQGDVDLASYAAVPHLVRVHRARGQADWSTYGLIEAIEWARHAERNPALPAWLQAGYERAWDEVVPLALGDLESSTEPLLNRCALGVIAMARGLRVEGHRLVTSSDLEPEDEGPVAPGSA